MNKLKISRWYLNYKRSISRHKCDLKIKQQNCGSYVDSKPWSLDGDLDVVKNVEKYLVYACAAVCAVYVFALCCVYINVPPTIFNGF